MAKNKYYQYEYAKSFLYNKDNYINNFIENMLNKCYSMFNYKNLPCTIDKINIEKYLLLNGHCLFTKINDNYYVLDGSFSGLENVYHRFHQYLVNNIALNLEGKIFELDNDIDGVLITNDGNLRGLYPIFAKYGVMLNDCEITLNMLSVLNRLPYLFTSADEKTKNNADEFLNKIKNGDFSILADNAFIDTFKAIQLNNQNTQITHIMELTQFIRANCNNELGLSSQWNTKRERINTKEVDIDDDILTPLITNMLYCRKSAIEKINKKYKLNIEVDLNDVWKEKQVEIENEIKTLSNNNSDDNNSDDNGDNKNDNE